MGSKHTALIDTFLLSVSRHPKDLGLYYKSPTGRVQSTEGWWISFGLPGLGDVTGVLPDGRAIYLEFKVGRDKLRASQNRFSARIKSLNAVYIEVRSVEEAIKELEALCSH